ncbi:hypothetical protein [Streptomyces tendae]|uniref:hypothetical protein n=1 Tax=Streptomyces tendae TaxID=1932 RepID=UPI003717DEB9
MRLRRTAAVAALSIALPLTACGSSEHSGPADGPAAGPSLSDATLEKLTVVGTVADLQVTEPAEDSLPEGAYRADKDECLPIVQLAFTDTPRPATARAVREFTGPGELNSTVGGMWVTAHQGDDARLALDDVRKALTECSGSFKVPGAPMTYRDLEPAQAPDLGDESVGFRFTTSLSSVSSPATYAVVRTGRILTTMVVITDTLPQPLLEAQLARLPG